jgi:hypothetical protein
MSNVLSQFLAGSQAGMNAQDFREKQALRQQQAERDTETYGLNKAVNNARILKGAMDAIERVSPDPNVRYETAVRMRPQLERLGVTDIPFDQLTPEDFSPEKFNIHKQSIAGFIQDPQQQLTAWERQRNQILKDLDSTDPRVRKIAEIEVGLEGRAAQKPSDKIVMVGDVPSVGSATDKTVTPLISAKDVAANKSLIAGETELAKGRAKTSAKQESMASGIEGFMDYYRSIPDELRAIKDAPESKVSEVANQFVSNFIGNTKAADATQKLRQIASLVLKGSPFAPGSQSDKELAQRKQELAAQIENANMSVEAKIEAVNAFVKANEMQMRALKTSAEKGRSAIGAGLDQPAQNDFDMEYDPATGTFK